MKVMLAKSAGFCFGVRRAVQLAEKIAAGDAPYVMLGPVIHNDHVIEHLAEQGVGCVERVDQVPPGCGVIIRSHGEGKAVYDKLQEMGCPVADATCVKVAKIHQIVQDASRRGRQVIIIGDPVHPEVTAIAGWCTGAKIFRNATELGEFLKEYEENPQKPITLVSQTTSTDRIWSPCREKVKKECTNAEIFDTICDATAKRQNEAVELSQKSDIMVIVGGRQSSNTAKLRDVCAAHCPTVLVETADELPASLFDGVQTAGLTAGASTPADIIKEVLSTMSEIEKNNEVQKVEDAAAAETKAQAAATDGADTAPAKSFDEMSFEEALEASLQSLNTDERVRGVVVGIAPNEVQVEVVGRKQAGYIPLNELSADPNAKAEDLVKVGDELELLIMRTNDQEGTIMLSKKRVDAMKGWDKVVEAEESGEILEGTVTDIIKGGMLAVTNGVRVFIPASQASAMRMEDLSPLKGQTVRFRIIETNKSRRRAVGSVRQVAREERKEKENAFWEKAEIGQTYTGVVKSLTSYGAFVDIGGVDGMIHISELSWSRIKHPSEVVNVGDTVQVYIKDLDHEKRKISLGYRKAEDNPWEILKEKYPVGSVVKAKIVGMTTFGAFAQILPGVDGLIHISQIADHRVEKPQDELKMGEEVTVKITNIDFDKKRISLSIRELLEEAADSAEETPETSEEE